MKVPSRGLLLALVYSLPFSAATAGQVEADFNDLKLGDTRTRGNNISPNDNRLNTGSGFLAADASATGGPGEYNNNTGVLQFEKGDLAKPAGIAGFVSTQGTPVDSAAAGFGVVFGSGTETGLATNKYRRFQERRISSPMNGSEVYFSFLFRLDGPLAEGRVLFNKPSTENSSDVAAAAFAVSIGNQTQPGAIAIDTAATATPTPITDPASVYFDSLGNDLNHNGQLDGVDVGLGNIANIKNHLIIGRVTLNASGADLIEVWLDPANVNNLGVPTLTATDEIGTDGITSVAFEGTRFIAPIPTGGPYVDGGHFALDHFRMSDQSNALAFVTGNVAVDPKLSLSTTSPASDFNFRGVYGATTPVTSTPITVILKNTGATNNITIHSVKLATDSTIFTITSLPVTDLVLAPNASFPITVQASSSEVEVLKSNSIVVDTDVDSQDLNIGVTATFFTGGSRVNANPSFENNLDGWVSDDYLAKTPAIRVSPGFFGSTGMARLHGLGDPSGGNPDNLSQTFLNGASDWEFAFVFSPTDAANFETRTGFPIQPGDRTFQVVIQSDGNVPQPASGTEGAFTEAANARAALINLAYMPQNGGFCAFNGSSWQSLGLPLITGSTDGNNNGVLNAANTSETDIVNAYLVRIKGTGFGSTSAKYSVSVSAPNSVTTANTAANLSIFSSSSGQTKTPGGYTFTTGDVSDSGIIGGFPSKTTSFWIDEVTFSSSQARDPDVAAGGTVTVLSHNGVTPAGTGYATVTNRGFTQDLSVFGASFGKPSIFSTAASFPIVIPPGSSAQIPININPANFLGTDNAALTNLTVNTNFSFQPDQVISVVGAGTTDSNLIPNWNFEVLGTDPYSDFDSFAFWDEYITANESKDVPGLVTGSPHGVYLGQGSAIRTNFGVNASDFIIDTYFAVKESANRALNMTVIAENGGSINLRYEAHKWDVYQDAWNTIIDMTSNPLGVSVDANNNLSLDDSGDAKVIYKLRISGTGWKSDAPTYKIQILDMSDNVVASSADGLTIFQFGTPTGGAKTLTLNANNTTNAGFWADDINARFVSTTNDIVVTSFTIGSGGATITWTSGGRPVTIERSTSLLPGSWTPVTTANLDGSFTDGEPPLGQAFYRIRLE